jgi:hypothetical protein
MNVIRDGQFLPGLTQFSLHKKSQSLVSLLHPAGRYRSTLFRPCELGWEEVSMKGCSIAFLFCCFLLVLGILLPFLPLIIYLVFCHNKIYFSSLFHLWRCSFGELCTCGRFHAGGHHPFVSTVEPPTPSISCGVGPVVISSHSFCSSGKYRISPSILKDIFASYRILSWYFLFFFLDINLDIFRNTL